MTGEDTKNGMSENNRRNKILCYVIGFIIKSYPSASKGRGNSEGRRTKNDKEWNNRERGPTENFLVWRILTC